MFRIALGSFLTVVLLAFVSQANADIFAIEDGDSDFIWDNTLTADDGNIEFTGANSDFQYGEGWFIRVGNTVTELLNGTSNIDQSKRFGTVTFDDVNNQFDVVIGYSITELGQDRIGLGVSAALQNVSGGTLSASLYSYFDYDIQFEADDHTADLINLGNGDRAMHIRYEEGSVYRRANATDHWRMDEYDVLYQDILDGDDLDDSGSPFGPGDFTGAYQWDFQLADGEIFLTTSSVIASIPEPSMVIFLAFAFGAIVLYKRMIPRFKNSSR